jgi:hypothetical protein
VHHLKAGGRHAGQARQLDGCPEQDIGLQRLAGLEVHQHRGLVGADLRGPVEAALDGDLGRAAEAGGNLRGLAHHRQDQLARARMGGDLAHGRPGEDADRVESHVAEQLEPDVSAQVPLNRALEAAGDHRRAERRAALGDAAVWLPDGEPGALDVPDDSRCLDLGRAVHHAADRRLRRDHRRDRAARVGRLDATSRMRAG